MEKKNDLTIEELTKAYEEAKNNFNTLGERLKKAQQEEENRKREELARTKEARKKEIEEVAQRLETLIKAWFADYDYFTFEQRYNHNNIFPYILRYFF